MVHLCSELLRKIYGTTEPEQIEPSVDVITLSAIEIFQDGIRDMLGSAQPLKLVVNEIGCYADGAVPIVVESTEQVAKLIATAFKSRGLRENARNKLSSTANTIVTITLNRADAKAPKRKSNAVQRKPTSLTLVVLAGSENSVAPPPSGSSSTHNLTGSQSVLFGSGNAVGLNALAACVADLSSGQPRPAFYKSSLTRLLQRTLLGFSKLYADLHVNYRLA